MRYDGLNPLFIGSWFSAADEVVNYKQNGS